jgi:polyphosphate kinase 2 (PPK2 family)
MESPAVIEGRYGLINEFEHEAAAAGIIVIKCFLHISYDEQRNRMLGRLDDPTKLWKFHEGDLDERAFWADYMDAYDTAIRRCSEVPWYVVPADHKWASSLAVATLMVDALTAMDPQYPPPSVPLDGITVE